jgi:hypothetical protein
LIYALIIDRRKTDPTYDGKVDNLTSEEVEEVLKMGVQM